MAPSKEELDILGDSSFLLLKNSLNEKIIKLLGEIEAELRPSVEAHSFLYPADTYLKSGKISKGEQYQGLPYFMLDYPRKFTREEIFAFRTMLWWGNHFSCTLHLEGDTLLSKKDHIVAKLIDENDLYFCVNHTPWEYHFLPDNYQRIEHLTKDKIIHQIEQYGFIKISSKIYISEWFEFKLFTMTTLARFLRLLK